MDGEGNSSTEVSVCSLEWDKHPAPGPHHLSSKFSELQAPGLGSIKLEEQQEPPETKTWVQVSTLLHEAVI